MYKYTSPNMVIKLKLPFKGQKTLMVWHYYYYIHHQWRTHHAPVSTFIPTNHNLGNALFQFISIHSFVWEMLYHKLPHKKHIILRLGDIGRAIFFQFICFTKQLENIFSLKYTNLMKNQSRNPNIWSEFPYVLWFLSYGPKYGKQKFSTFPCPQK